jgi:hypothetical protein
VAVALVIVLFVVLIAAITAVGGMRGYPTRGWLFRRTLSAEDREYYKGSWTHVQGSFLDHPAFALESAERLVGGLLAARGYRSGDPDALPTRYAGLRTGYREALLICEHARAEPNSTSTEAMRGALLDFRALSDSLLA